MLIELLTKRYPGMRAWLSQRLTGLAMAIYSVLAVGRFFYLAPSDYASWLEFFAPLWWRIVSLLFWVALTLHAWLGIRDVFKDYVPNASLRALLLNGLVGLLWLYLAWASYVLLV